MTAYRKPGKYRPGAGERILAGALAGVTTALGLAAWLGLRTFVVRPLMQAAAKPLAWRWVDSASFVLLGLAWLVLVYVSAYAYQRAVERRRLWRLFARVTLFEMLIPGLAAGIALLLVRIR